MDVDNDVIIAEKGDKQPAVVVGDQCEGANTFSPLSDTVGPNPLCEYEHPCNNDRLSYTNAVHTASL